MVKVQSLDGREDPLEKHGDFLDGELNEIRRYVEKVLEDVIESGSHTADFDIIEGNSIVDRPVAEANSGDHIMFWPNTSDGIDNETSVSSSKLESYFAGGYGVECVVQ